MIFTLRLCILIVILGFLFSRATFGQDRPGETRTFGFAEDVVDRPDSMEAVIFQPDPESDEGFLLFLESSMDLETWEVEGLQDYQLNEDGTIVATGADALDRKFWRLRIMHPSSQDESEWLAVLKVSRAETSVTAMLTVRTNYFPFIQSYVQYAVDLLPTLEWDAALEDPGPTNVAVEAALMRILEIIEGTRPADGDYYEATRPIE